MNQKKIKNMEAKEISVIVTYRGQIPQNANMDEVYEKIERRLDDCFRIEFEPEDEDEYDEDIHAPFFEQNNLTIAENGYQIAIN